MGPLLIATERRNLMERLERLPSWKLEELFFDAERYAQEVERRVNRLLRPRTRKDGEGFLCSDSHTHLLGTGPRRDVARDDYMQALRDMYESLKDDEQILHARLVPQFELLRSVSELQEEG